MIPEEVAQVLYARYKMVVDNALPFWLWLAVEGYTIL